MLNKMLIVGFVCFSMTALAQSNNNNGQPAKTASHAREAASGQATGKPAPNPKSADRESSAPSVSEVVVTKPSNAKLRVAAGDVNGDGHADVAATAGSNGNTQKAATTNSHSNAQSPRDAASGQASGKRQHQPLQIKKEVDSSSPKL